MSERKLYKKLDLSGSSCAGPIGEVSGVFEELAKGEFIEVVLGDQATKRDIMAWAKRVGAMVEEEASEGGKPRLLIGRA